MVAPRLGPGTPAAAGRAKRTVSALLLFAVSAGAAAQPWGMPYPGTGDPPNRSQPPRQEPQPRQQQAWQHGRWRFRPQAPSNARGVPPLPTPSPQAPAGGSGGYPGAPGWSGPGGPYRLPRQPQGGGYPAAGYGRYPSGQNPRPELELELSDRRPYLQEAILLRLRVVSSGNLATASPDVSGFDQVLLEELAGPTTSTRSAERGRRIVNEYVLTLTPLRTGELEVGPLSVSGTLAAGVGFRATAAEPLRLSVRPAVASVQPWLALRSLDVTRELLDDGGLKEGEPVTLRLRMEADGGRAEQLPSLEPTLEGSPDFRIYRERTRNRTRLSDDGRRLIATRSEDYTLVPHSGGRVQLPAVRVDWWNVEAERPETSGVPIRSLEVAGESGPFGFAKSTARSEGGGSWSWVGMPLAGLLLLLIGYWGGVWYRLHGPQRRAPALAGRSGAALARAAAGLRRRLRDGLRWLDPRPPLAAARGRLAARAAELTPASVRVYRCARSAASAETPDEWAVAFQRQACHRLCTPNQEPLPRVADRLLSLRPGADSERVRRLMQELDSALYNGSPIDFARWKHDFRRALRPGLGGLRGLIAGRVRRRRLPPLNPRPSNS